jgi:tRNA G18 (ribose-2'-O)-methylase SpoU
MRGFFEIGIYHTKTEVNVGTLWRSAYQLGASGIFTIGKRYKKQSSDTMKSWKQIPLRHYETFDDFKEHMPLDCQLIPIEMGGHPLSNVVHPERAIYLLGAEDYGIPKEITEKCKLVISLESVGQNSYNVAVAGSIVMYHRFMTGKKIA